MIYSEEGLGDRLCRFFKKLFSGRVTCLGFDVVGIDNFFKGILFPSENEKELANAIIQLFKNEGMVRKGREWLEVRYGEI
ncbi:hypothetical protein ES706_06304 [subsurface metagenome]